MQKPKKLKKYQKPKVKVELLLSKLGNNFLGSGTGIKGRYLIDEFLLAAQHCIDGY